jgi:peptide/nickel transport system permease protein
MTGYLESKPARVRRRVLRTVALCAAGGVLVALLAPMLAPYDPAAVGDLLHGYGAPSRAHWLGTDEFGRDVLSRLLWGARVSLTIGGLTALLAGTLGGLVGLVAGLRPGRIDAILMRGVDLLLSLPRTYLVVLVAGLLRPSLPVLVAILAATGWMRTARLVRAQVHDVARGSYVEAARALGLSPWRIALRHVLPNAAAPLIVSVTAMVGNTILVESALSFLGLGVQVPTPSWGAMVEEGRQVFPDLWWVAITPSIAITCTVLTCNLLGDALRDALDPRAASTEGVS